MLAEPSDAVGVLTPPGSQDGRHGGRHRHVSAGGGQDPAPVEQQRLRAAARAVDRLGSARPRLGDLSSSRADGRRSRSIWGRSGSGQVRYHRRNSGQGAQQRQKTTSQSKNRGGVDGRISIVVKQMAHMVSKVAQ